jgi:hypothetical protein
MMNKVNLNKSRTLLVVPPLSMWVPFLDARGNSPLCPPTNRALHVVCLRRIVAVVYITRPYQSDQS